MNSLGSERLMMIYNKDVDGLSNALKQYKDKQSHKEFKCEVLICFWFAIDRQSVAIAQYLYKIDTMI